MVTVRVEVKPALFDFARARSGIGDADWQRRFPKFDEWRSGDRKPTLKQLQDFANKTHTPFGFLLLEEAPDEPLPIADFRSPAAGLAQQPSGNLLDTIYSAQGRQAWFRDHQLLNNEDPVEWIGTASTQVAPAQAAEMLREVLDWTAGRRSRCRTWEDALTELREQAERAGVLVMIAGYTGRATRRTLDTSEFSGFALSDQYAPVAFVNGRDPKARQIFTLAHELAHLLIASTGLSEVEPVTEATVDEERWCNATAAELLVPAAEFDVMVTDQPIAEQLQPLAKHFRVSTQVILGRFRETGRIDWPTFWQLFEAERARIAAIVAEPGTGGNYYNSRPVQVSKRFAGELIASVYEGTTSFTEAMRLIGTRKASTLESMGERLGVL